MLRTVLHVLTPIAAAWFALLALSTLLCGILDLPDARLIASARPELARALVVERMQIVDDEPRQWRVEGHLASDPTGRLHALTLAEDDIDLLSGTGGRLAVVETGDRSEPLVTRRWYEAQAMLLLGAGVAVPQHLIAGLALAAAAFPLLLHVRRAAPAARQLFVQAEDGRAGLATRHAGLVARLERCAARDLGAFRRRVLAVALLGYAYVLGVAVLFAATLLALLPALLDCEAPSAAGAALGALAIGGAVVAALRLRVKLPHGGRVTRAEAPVLFARLDALRARIGGPRLHEVLVTEEFNAAILQQPRLGLFGWPRNHLLIGLPLMQALTVEQFTAVLAHEYGHVAQADGRFAAWTQRVRQSWLRLSGAMDAGGRWRGFLFQRFLDCYAPWFNAYSFVLARRSELIADQAAARIVSSRTMVDALAAVAVRGRQLDAAFWPKLYDGARSRPEPPAVYRALGVALKQGLPPRAAEAHLRAALSRRSRMGDTHPTLGARARALGQEPRVPPAPMSTAAEELLGPALETLLQRCDASWTARFGTAWRDTYAEAQRELGLLAELEARAAGGGLSLAERWCRAKLTERARDEAGAERLYREIVAGAADHGPSLFALARLMLERGEVAEGLAHLEGAIAADAEAEVPGCELGAYHLERLGRSDQAGRFRLRLAAARGRSRGVNS